MRLEDIFADRYTVCNTVNNPAMFLRRVEYTSDESRLHPTIRTRKGDWIVYGLGDFGTHKRPEWQFQSEWRFIITILPAPVRYPSLPQSQWSEEFERQMHKGITSGSLAFEDFYLDLNEEALNRIDIVLGPKCTKDEEMIVGSLLSKHCAGPSLRSSSLKGSIR